jgi:predicted nucleic acid-binding protein
VTVAVSDAGPLIHLYEAAACKLLEIFSALRVPSEVWRETVGEGRVPERALVDLGVRPEPILNDLAPFVATHGLGTLHPGDQECLCFCHRNRIPILLTDDLAAREAAKRLTITPVGSLGVIVKAYHLGRISLEDAEHALHLLQRSSLFVTPTIIDLVLEQLHRTE